MSRPARRTLAAIAALLIGAGAGTYATLRPIPVISHVVTPQTVIAEVMGTGTLEARTDATISSTISARIEALTVDQGDRVDVGQVLLRLDDSDLSRSVEVARADLATATAGVERARADRVRAEAVTSAARRELARVQDLVVKGVVSELDADEAHDALRIAEASSSSARSAVREAERRAAASARALELHEARLTETVIRAPFAGLITQRHRQAGDVLVPGSPVLTLISTELLWISAWVDETEMGRLAVGQPARVVLRSHPERELAGAVARLGRAVDRETREFVVDVRLDALPERWAIGQRAEVFIAVDRADRALVVLPRLIHRDGDTPGVFVAEGERARWTEVELGLRGPCAIEVVSGLRDGDRVLEPATSKPLRSGARVAPTP